MNKLIGTIVERKAINQNDHTVTIDDNTYPYYFAIEPRVKKFEVFAVTKDDHVILRRQ